MANTWALNGLPCHDLRVYACVYYNDTSCSFLGIHIQHPVDIRGKDLTAHKSPEVLDPSNKPVSPQHNDAPYVKQESLIGVAASKAATGKSTGNYLEPHLQGSKYPETDYVPKTIIARALWTLRADVYCNFMRVRMISCSCPDSQSM